MIWMMATLSLAATVDGRSTGDSYGTALAVQTVQTGFGDNFSELNAAYGTIENDRLDLLVTGNIEANFNSLWIWLDTGAANGQNVIEASVGGGGTNPDTGLGGPIFDNLAGLTFDPGFAPTHALWVQRGASTFDVRVVELGAGNAGFGEFLGAFGAAVEGSATNLPTVWGMDIAYDDSNNAGVQGGTAAANQAAAQAVTTGLEVSIPLASIGSPTGDIRAMSHINNGDMNFLSNQALGGLPAGTGNLGGDGSGNFTGTVSGVDYGAFAGDQFFVVAQPAPEGVLDCGTVARADVCALFNAAVDELHAAEGEDLVDEASDNVRLRPSTLYGRLEKFADLVDTEGSCTLDGWMSGRYYRRDLTGSFTDGGGDWSLDGDLTGDRRFAATTSAPEALSGRFSARSRKVSGLGEDHAPFGGVFVRLSGKRGVYVGLNTTCSAASTVAVEWLGESL